jgi:Xaa-Pro dipeptidase
MRMVQRMTARSENLVNMAAFEVALTSNGLDALLAVSPKNVFYYSGSGTAREKLYDSLPHTPGSPLMSAVLAIPGGGNCLICPVGEAQRAKAEAWVERIDSYEPYRQSPMDAVAEALAQMGLADARIGIEAEYLTIDFYHRLKELSPRTVLIPADGPFEWIRSLKTPGELALCKATADLLDDAFLEAFSTIGRGDTEWDFHSCVIESALRRGAEYCRGFVAAGENNDINFFGTNHKVLEPGDIVHTDYATYLHGYPSNLSRLGVVGEPSKSQMKQYANLLAVENRIVEFMRPGVTGRDVFLFCRRACFELGYIHTAPILGHNLGLGYHDRPMLTEAETMPLEPTNHIALEPLFEWTFHIQDQVVIESDGARIISDKFDTSELFVME